MSIGCKTSILVRCTKFMSPECDLADSELDVTSDLKDVTVFSIPVRKANL